VIANDREGLYEDLEEVLRKRRLRIAELECNLDIDRGEIRFSFVVTQQKKRIGHELVQVISALEGVKKISFK